LSAQRILVMSDFHCGHLVGLTPPAWQLNPRNTTTKANKFAKIQRELWGYVAREVEALRPIDTLFVNGDLIDGRGKANEGGTEHITTDREEQAAMAVEIIKIVGAKDVVLTFGTTFHTGADGEDWESIISQRTGARKIGSHEFVRVGGVTFNLKHHLGSSAVPHGRYTALAREKLWEELWQSRKGFPQADVLIRSHVHYHTFIGGPGWLAMTTPALQGLGSKYGARRCNGIVDFGFIHFDLDGKGGYSWQSHIVEFQNQRPEVLDLD
jgi:hypothetical protein